MEPSPIDILYQRFESSNGVSTDTRSIKEDEIFFALKGPNFDANEFAKEAVRKGATLAVVDSDLREFREDPNFFLVEDALKSLQALARRYRDDFDIPVLGLTGSNGKTTTKELIHTALSTGLKAYSTPGNLNNHIGVPLTLLRMPVDTEIAIIELGANHLGEIDALCQICKPNYGLITNIGKDHLEGFGSFEGSLRANSELYNYLIQNGGEVFINSNDEILKNMSKRFSNPIMYPNKGDFYHSELVQANPFLEIQLESGSTISTNLIGEYNFDNIAAALTVSKTFNISEENAANAISEYSPRNNRSQWIETEKNKILLDAYNANPSSMHVALDSFMKIDGEKVVILGDMFELGDYEKEEHEELISRISQEHLSLRIVCGKAMHSAAEGHDEIVSFSDKDELHQYLAISDFRGKALLLKGSRGMRMEDCVEFL